MSVNIYDSSTDTLTRVDNSYGIINCSTARSTAAKVVALSGFKLYKGARITVRFTDTGSSNPSSGNLSLNVNSTGAKKIVDGHTNKTVLTYSNANYFYNNQVADFVYDGTNWVYLNRDKDTTYNGSSLKTNAAKTGTAQSAITDTIAASTTMDNAIGTLLNNDKTLESDVQTLKNNEDAMLNVLGAKNLIDVYASSQTISGVTFTVNPDKTIKAVGTATAQIALAVWDGKLSSGRYIKSGCPSGGSNSTYFIGGSAGTSTGDVNDYGEGFEFETTDSSSISVVIVIRQGVTVNLTFKPMIRPASVADDTYAPYAMTNRELSNAFGVNMGVSGLYAYKMGRVVMLSIVLPTVSNTSGGWKSIVTLPEELAPLSGALLFSLYDNSANTQASSTVVPAQISTSNILNIYLFGDKLTVTPRGVITYISKY